MNTGSISKSTPQTVVAHLGARLHYGAAEALNNSGMLKKLFTDVYLDRNTSIYKILDKISGKISYPLLKKVLYRSSHLDSTKVTSFTLLGIQYWLELVRHSANTDIFLKYNRIFGNKVANYLPGLTFSSIYGFSGSSLEIFQKARELNAYIFLEQMSAPALTSQEVITSEKERWPGWQTYFSTLWNTDEWHTRELREWEIADRIIVPSPYVEEQLSKYNINPTKITRIPYAVSLHQFIPKPRSYNRKRKLKTLYIGDLRLLKGTPYLLQAINKIGSDHIDLACIGNNFLDNKILNMYRDMVRFIGAVPSQEVLKWYEWTDILVMPSLCEGSATVTYEAKVSGIPVIATYNSGAWLEDGIDGLWIPARSSVGIANALEQFLDTPTLVNEMSKAAIEKRHKFGWEAYRQNLYNLITTEKIHN